MELHARQEVDTQTSITVKGDGNNDMSGSTRLTAVQANLLQWTGEGLQDS